MRRGLRRYQSRFPEQRGQGIGMGNGRQGDGGAVTCQCPECGNEESHARGIPCNEVSCPECGTRMMGK